MVIRKGTIKLNEFDSYSPVEASKDDTKFYYMKTQAQRSLIEPLHQNAMTFG